MAKALNIDKLRAMRNQLVEGRQQQIDELRDERRWSVIDGVVEALVEAAEARDLGGVAEKVRKMKNILRKKGTKKELAKIKKASCSRCGKPLETVYGDEPVEGALCSDCALKDRVPVPGETADKKNRKKAERVAAFPPEAQMGMGGVPGGVSGEPGGGENDEEEGEQTAGAGSPAAKPKAPVAPVKKKKKEKKEGFPKKKRSPKTESAFAARRQVLGLDK